MLSTKRSLSLHCALPQLKHQDQLSTYNHFSCYAPTKVSLHHIPSWSKKLWPSPEITIGDYTLLYGTPCHKVTISITMKYHGVPYLLLINQPSSFDYLDQYWSLNHHRSPLICTKSLQTIVFAQSTSTTACGMQKNIGLDSWIILIRHRFLDLRSN